jgi:hypothetical protein
MTVRADRDAITVKCGYKVLNGTSYHAETPDQVVRALEHARLNRLRIRLYYGEMGKSWGEMNDVTGYVGRSMGPIQVPIILFNARSHGGAAISTDRVVAIRLSAKGANGAETWLVRHPSFEKHADDN